MRSLKFHDIFNFSRVRRGVTWGRGGGDPESLEYLPTLPVFAGVSKFFIKSPGLPVRTPNLPGNTYRGFFQICFNNLVVFEMSEGFSALIDTVSSKLSPTMADPEN